MKTQLGISGCRVTLEQENGELFVRKQSLKSDYNPRLQSQAYKQAMFASVYQGHGQIRVPRVLSVYEDYFNQEYIPALDYIEFIETASSTEVSNMLDKVVSLVHTWKGSCFSVVNVYPFIFTSAMTAIQTSFIAEETKERVRDILDNVIPERDCTMPAGVCHGDLTMSNILFDDDGKIVLIDWHDREPTGYFFDLIKLRQDALYNWTSINTIEQHDSIKTSIINDELSRRILATFPEIVVSSCFQLLEAINYLRVLQYTEHLEKVCEVVTQAFNESCEKYERRM